MTTRGTLILAKLKSAIFWKSYKCSSQWQGLNIMELINKIVMSMRYPLHNLMWIARPHEELKVHYVT
jgi:hypothetical protein